MRRRSGESNVARLRHEAEVALRRSRSRGEVEPLLERLERMAEEGSEPWMFAHRQLAELRLEAHPWRAALHLRQALRFERNDDVVHALLGLCHALLGNYRSAVGAYRRALAIAPRNPWYHHNLGHLLDVALGLHAEAEAHLRMAHRMEPDEDEITASLAHCLARLARLDEAKLLADEAVRFAPHNPDHQALLAWIGDGAPEGATPPFGGSNGRNEGRSRSRRPRRAGSAARSRSPGGARRARSDRARAVLQVLERRMREAGFSAHQVERASALWSDFREGRQVRVQKPEVYAAAVEYAIALVHGIDGVTKAAVARRYGVAPTSLSSRYDEIRHALELRPGDSRYGAQ